MTTPTTTDHYTADLEAVRAHLRLDTKGRPKVHTVNQLAAVLRALGLSADEIARARAADLIPGPDRPAGTWSGPLTERIALGAGGIRLQLPDDLSAEQLKTALGLDYGPWRRARESRVIPDPDRPPYWTRAAADRLIERAEQLRARIPGPSLGPYKCATLLAELTALPVVYEDIAALGEAGHITPDGEYKGVCLWNSDELTDLAASEAGRAAIAEIVEDRMAWIEESIDLKAAARQLHWTQLELARVLRARKITPGRLERYPRVEIAVLARDEQLDEQVRGARQLRPWQAKDYLGVRETEFRAAVSLGWLVPADHEDVKVRRKWIKVPVYRTDHLETVADRVPAGVDWAALRGLGPGEPSPLRHLLVP